MVVRIVNVLFNMVVNFQGVIEVCLLCGKNGWIVFDGGLDGKVMVGGVLFVNVLNGLGYGGMVEVWGQVVEVVLGIQVNMFVSNGFNGIWKIVVDKIDVCLLVVLDGVIVYVDILLWNLVSINIELVLIKGDLDFDGLVNWVLGNWLGLGFVVDLMLNGRLNVSGVKVGLELKVEGVIDINDKIVFGGVGSVLVMDVGEGYWVNGMVLVFLVGVNVIYVFGGYYYMVVQNLVQLQVINKNLDGLYVFGGNILGGSYYCMVL